MPPRDKSWTRSIGSSRTLRQNSRFCTVSVAKMFTRATENDCKSSNTLFTGLKVHSVLVNVVCEFSFWADFALSPPLYYLSHCLLLSPLSLPPPTFKCAFYQSNSWAAAERSTSSAIKNKKRLQLPYSLTLYGYYCLDPFSLVKQHNSAFWWAYWSYCLVIPYLNTGLPHKAQRERMYDEKREFVFCVINVLGVFPLILLSFSFLLLCWSCSK